MGNIQIEDVGVEFDPQSSGNNMTGVCLRSKTTTQVSVNPQLFLETTYRETCTHSAACSELGQPYVPLTRCLTSTGAPTVQSAWWRRHSHEWECGRGTAAFDKSDTDSSRIEGLSSYVISRMSSRIRSGNNREVTGAFIRVQGIFDPYQEDLRYT